MRTQGQEGTQVRGGEGFVPCGTCVSTLNQDSVHWLGASDGLNLSPNEIRAAVFGIAEFRRARALAAKPIPNSIEMLWRRLDTHFRCPSRTRQQSDAQTGESETWIDSPTAARMLGWSLRRVQRRAGDLDAQRIAGRLAFPAKTVHDYANHQRQQQK